MFEEPFCRFQMPSSCVIHHWILWIVVVLTGVLFTGVLESAASEDFSGVHFVGQMHTIGSINGTLWAIIKSDTKEFIVYKLTPCKADNDSFLVHCMVISEPVPMDSKWPLLGQSIKQAANITDYSSLDIGTSVIVYKKSLDDTIVIMQSSAFKHKNNPEHTEYVGFSFGTNRLAHYVLDFNYRREGAWISSDDQNSVYIILGMGTKVQNLYLGVRIADYDLDIILYYYDNEKKNICNAGTTDQPRVLFTSDECKLRMEWTIYKGLHFQGQFYFFDSDRVFIFSDKVQNESSKVYIIELDTFFSYVEPTTTVATPVNSIVFVEETTEPTTAKAILPSTILIYIVLACIALLGIGLFIYCNVLPESDNQEGDINKRIPTPNNNNSNLKGKRNNNNNRRPHSGKNASRRLKGPSKNRLSLSKCKIDSKSKAVSKEKVVVAKSSAKSNAKSNAKANAKTNSKVGVKMCSKSRNKMSNSKQTTGKHFTSSKQVYNKLNK